MSDTLAKTQKSPSLPDPRATQRDKHGSYKHWLTKSIRQMMYVSGETAEPPVETTGIIEDIVRQQVIELVSPPPPHTLLHTYLHIAYFQVY